MHQATSAGYLKLCVHQAMPTVYTGQRQQVIWRYVYTGQRQLSRLSGYMYTSQHTCTASAVCTHHYSDRILINEAARSPLCSTFGWAFSPSSWSSCQCLPLPFLHQPPDPEAFFIIPDARVMLVQLPLVRYWPVSWYKSKPFDIQNKRNTLNRPQTHLLYRTAV